LFLAVNLCHLAGGYFIGRPTNHAPTEEPAAGGSGGGEHTPGGAFILSSPLLDSNRIE